MPLFTPQIHLIHRYTPLYLIFALYTFNKFFYYLYLHPKSILFTYIRHYTSIFAIYTFYKCFYYLYLLLQIRLIHLYSPLYTHFCVIYPTNSPIYAIIHPYLPYSFYKCFYYLYLLPKSIQNLYTPLYTHSIYNSPIYAIIHSYIPSINASITSIYSPNRLVYLYTPLYTHICPIYHYSSIYAIIRPYLPYIPSKSMLFTYIRHYTPIFAIYTFQIQLIHLYTHYTPIFAIYTFYKWFYYSIYSPNPSYLPINAIIHSYLPHIPSINASITYIYSPNRSYSPIYAIIHLFTPQIQLIHLYTPLYTHFALYSFNKCFFYLYLLPKFAIFAIYTFYKWFYYLYLLIFAPIYLL